MRANQSVLGHSPSPFFWTLVPRGMNPNGWAVVLAAAAPSGGGGGTAAEALAAADVATLAGGLSG